MLSQCLVKMSCFFTCLFESLNLPPNQHKMYGTKQLFRKGCMYANHMIYRVERVCATNLRTGAWPNKSRTKRMFLVSDFVVFSLFCGFNLCIDFWWYFKWKMAPKMTSKSMPKSLTGDPRRPGGAARTHWDCYLVVKNESKGRIRKLPKKHKKTHPAPSTRRRRIPPKNNIRATLPTHTPNPTPPAL